MSEYIRSFGFRVWDTLENKYIRTLEYDYAITEAGHLVKIEGEEAHYPSDSGRYLKEFSPGYADKNYLPIYEGDICQNLDKGYYYKIKNKKGIFYPSLIFFKGIQTHPEMYCTHDDFETDEWEIIGNIHENPKFLE